MRSSLSIFKVLQATPSSSRSRNVTSTILASLARVHEGAPKECALSTMHQSMGSQDLVEVR